MSINSTAQKPHCPPPPQFPSFFFSPRYNSTFGSESSVLRRLSPTLALIAMSDLDDDECGCCTIMSTMAPAPYAVGGASTTGVAVVSSFEDDDDDDDFGITRNEMSTGESAPTTASMTSSNVKDETSTPMTDITLDPNNESLIDDDSRYADPPSFNPDTITPPPPSPPAVASSISASSRIRPSGFSRDSLTTSFVVTDDVDEDDDDIDVDVLPDIASPMPTMRRRIILEDDDIDDDIDDDATLNAHTAGTG